MSSSRPVNDTGWKETKLILSQFCERELHDRPDLIVVHGVDDRDDQAHVDAGGMQVLDRRELHFEQVPDLPMGVRRFGDAVELQVGDSKPGLASLAGKRRRPARIGCRWSRPGR